MCLGIACRVSGLAALAQDTLVTAYAGILNQDANDWTIKPSSWSHRVAQKAKRDCGISADSRLRVNPDLPVFLREQ